MVVFWNKLITGKETKLSTRIFSTLFIQNKYVSPWLAFIKSTLDECGLSDIWHGYQTLSLNCKMECLKRAVRTLVDQFTQQWSEKMRRFSKRDVYRAFKRELKLESYLTGLPKVSDRYLCK